MQMGELSFDFAEGLVVGLGIEGEEKRILGAKWQEFTKGAITFTVRLCGPCFTCLTHVGPPPFPERCTHGAALPSKMCSLHDMSK